jgi:hypothetical protein
MSKEELGQMLRGMFGDNVVSRSLRQFNKRLGFGVQHGQHRHTWRGGIYVPSKPALVTGSAASAAANATLARAHTFTGGALR